MPQASFGVLSVEKWNDLAQGLLKAEMAKRHMKAPDLATALEAIGVSARADNIKNKIARGNFTAGFFIQCLVAMEVKKLHLD
jgi:hypothetical protein